jgi:tetratricopeptide (TPR) repeat protein
MYPFATRHKSQITALLTKSFLVVILVLAVAALVSYWLKPPFTKFEQARNLIRAGKAARAVPILEDLQRRNPDDTSFLPWLAKGYLACDRLAEGRAALDKAIKLRVPPEKITNAVLAYSTYYQNNGDFTQAESLLDWAKPYCQIGEIQLAKAKLYLEWASQCESAGRTDEAIEKLEFAHSLIPEIVSNNSIADSQTYATIISNRLSQTLKREAAVFETRRKSNVQAIACLNKSLKITDLPSTRLQLADLYRQNGQRQDAIALLRQVIKNDANNLAAKHALIGLLTETKNLSGAKQALKELMKNEPGAENYQLLAKLESKVGNYSQAATALEEAISLKQGDLNLLKNLESVLIKWADSLAARGNLKECVLVKASAAKVRAKVADIEFGMSKKLGQAHAKPKAGQVPGGSLSESQAVPGAKLLIDQSNPSSQSSVDRLKLPILPQVPTQVPTQIPTQAPTQVPSDD